MDPKGRREVNLMVFGCANGVSSRRQVTVINVLSGGDKVLFRYGCTPGNHGGGAANALMEERWGTTRQREGGARTWLLLSVIIASHGCRGGGGHARAGAPDNLFICSSEVLSVLFGEQFAGTRCATFRSHMRVKADNSTINGATAASVVPIFWPVFLDCAPRFANVLKIRATEVFVLLNVEPEVQNVLSSLTLKE